MTGRAIDAVSLDVGGVLGGPGDHGVLAHFLAGAGIDYDRRFGEGHYRAKWPRSTGAGRSRRSSPTTTTASCGPSGYRRTRWRPPAPCCCGC